MLVSVSAYAGGLTFDAAGNLFVADMAVTDAGIGRWILRFSPNGTKSGFASGLASFLFTLKFDPEGNWKIVKTHQMLDKEVENFND